ncbi:hypothetical protein MTO96_037328 [Rhipicephalus appendiculatus]
MADIGMLLRTAQVCWVALLAALLLSATVLDGAPRRSGAALGAPAGPAAATAAFRCARGLASRRQHTAAAIAWATRSDAGGSLRKFRYEERTPEGAIVGEFGFHKNDGVIRGVRYTAEPGVHPKVLYEALVKFFSL